MAIVITFRGFKDLGRSATLIFLSIGRFLYRFSTFCLKMKKIFQVGSFHFLQNAPSNSVHLSSWFSYAAVSNAFLRVKVCENDGNI